MIKINSAFKRILCPNKNDKIVQIGTFNFHFYWVVISWPNFLSISIETTDGHVRSVDKIALYSSLSTLYPSPKINGAIWTNYVALNSRAVLKQKNQNAPRKICSTLPIFRNYWPFLKDSYQGRYEHVLAIKLQYLKNYFLVVYLRNFNDGGIIYEAEERKFDEWAQVVVFVSF